MSTNNEIESVSTFRRVSEWNKVCSKPSSAVGAIDFSEIILNQIQRISEEVQEFSAAAFNHDEIKILDGACDIDVTVAGLMYMVDMGDEDLSVVDTKSMAVIEFNDDRYNRLTNQINTFTNELASVFNYVNGDYGEVNKKIMFKLCNNLNHFTQSLIISVGHDYAGAINAVLDNNDLKIYDSCDMALAMLRVAQLNSFTDDTHSLSVSIETDDLSDQDIAKLMIEENINSELLEKFGGKYTIHRDHDDKVMKPENFPSVSLLPFIYS